MQCACLFSLIFLSFSFLQASEEESGKPFQCPICGLVIKRKSYWKRHMVIHTGLKSHQCPLCPFRCARKDNLKSHMKVSHLRMGLTERQAQPGPLHKSMPRASCWKVDCNANEAHWKGSCKGFHYKRLQVHPTTQNLKQRAASVSKRSVEPSFPIGKQQPNWPCMVMHFGALGGKAGEEQEAGKDGFRKDCWTCPPSWKECPLLLLLCHPAYTPRDILQGPWGHWKTPGL